VGFLAVFACMRIGKRTGIWGRDKQYKYVTDSSPKWTNRVAIGLLAYEVISFCLMMWRQTDPKMPKHELDPFFMMCASAVPAYGVMALVFHAAEKLPPKVT
jgi:hypothetical protein